MMQCCLMWAYLWVKLTYFSPPCVSISLLLKFSYYYHNLCHFFPPFLFLSQFIIMFFSLEIFNQISVPDMPLIQLSQLYKSTSDTARPPDPPFYLPMLSVHETSHLHFLLFASVCYLTYAVNSFRSSKNTSGSVGSGGFSWSSSGM